MKFSILPHILYLMEKNHLQLHRKVHTTFLRSKKRTSARHRFYEWKFYGKEEERFEVAILKNALSSVQKPFGSYSYLENATKD